jgi:hypothetical protein
MRIFYFKNEKKWADKYIDFGKENFLQNFQRFSEKRPRAWKIVGV